MNSTGLIKVFPPIDDTPAAKAGEGGSLLGMDHLASHIAASPLHLPIASELARCSEPTKGHESTSSLLPGLGLICLKAWRHFSLKTADLKRSATRERAEDEGMVVRPG